MCKSYTDRYEEETPIIERFECENCHINYQPITQGSMWLCGKCDKKTVYRSSPDTEDWNSSRFHQDAHGS